MGWQISVKYVNMFGWVKVTDDGLMGLYTICSVLQSLTLWNCVEVTDSGLRSLGNGLLLQLIVLYLRKNVGIYICLHNEGVRPASLRTILATQDIADTGNPEVGRARNSSSTVEVRQRLFIAFKRSITAFRISQDSRAFQSAKTCFRCLRSFQ